MSLLLRAVYFFVILIRYFLDKIYIRCSIVLCWRAYYVHVSCIYRWWVSVSDKKHVLVAGAFWQPAQPAAQSLLAPHMSRMCLGIYRPPDLAASHRSESPPFSIERHKDRRNQCRTTTRCARRRRRNTSTPSQQMSRKTALLHRLNNVNSVRGERSISICSHFS